jgi:hypothetical protein
VMTTWPSCNLTRALAPGRTIRVTPVTREPAKCEGQREAVSLRDSPREADVVASSIGVAVRCRRSSEVVKPLDSFRGDIHTRHFVDRPIDVALRNRRQITDSYQVDR